MAKNPLAPQQARSRESLERLMKAARDILNERGLDWATVPRVAARAGLSPGSVYRRFPNKDALMRAVVLQTLEALEASTASALTSELAERLSLQAFAETMVRQSLAAQRRNAKMLRAMHQFIMSHPSVAFKKKAAELNARSVQRVADFLLLKRGEMNHPDPRKAAPFALMLVGFALQEIIVLDALPGVPDPRLPKTDDELVEELARAFLRYLGAEHTSKVRS
jgi:AcrR family transcriptional regulator